MLTLDNNSKMKLLNGHNKSGWNEITNLLIKDINNILEKDDNLFIEVNYVKEKYGHLDISYDSNNCAEFDKLFLVYEDIFETTCCICGKNGKLDETLDWIVPLCDRCKKLGSDFNEKNKKSFRRR